MLVSETVPSVAVNPSWKRFSKLGVAVCLLSLLVVAAAVALNAHSPSGWLILAAQAFAVLSVLAGACALFGGIRHTTISRPNLVWPIIFLVAISLVTFGAHMYIINSPPTSQCTNATKLGCVMDEVFYVPASQTLLSGAQCAPYADNCNLEHPFLAKAFIAAGTAIFGSNDFGWRIFNALLGTLSIPLLFILVYVLSGNKKFSYVSTLLFAVDTMFFVHSSIALIDVPSIFFTLFALVLYFWPSRLWRFDNVIASGLLLGLALLSKETAIFAFGMLLTYQLFFAEGTVRHAFLDAFKLVAVTAVVFFLGLQVYDSLFTSAAVPTFVQDVAYIFKYGSALTGPGWKDAVLGSYITPLNWLTYYSPVAYLVTTVTTTVGSGPSATTFSYVGIGYYGVNNVIVLWMVYAWVPLALYTLVKSRRGGPSLTRDDKTALVMVLWFLWSYVPYVCLWLYGRVTYPFYILPAVPALAAGAAYFTTRDFFPRKLLYVYLLAALVWFVIYFPVKDFLPVFVRVWLGR